MTLIVKIVTINLHLFTHILQDKVRQNKINKCKIWVVESIEALTKFNFFITEVKIFNFHVKVYIIIGVVDLKNHFFMVNLPLPANGVCGNFAGKHPTYSMLKIICLVSNNTLILFCLWSILTIPQSIPVL